MNQERDIQNKALDDWNKTLDLGNAINAEEQKYMQTMVNPNQKQIQILRQPLNLLIIQTQLLLEFNLFFCIFLLTL